MNARPAYVSVIDPIGPAIERVRTVLFRPFDLGKWLVIGFSAWLAQYGREFNVFPREPEMAAPSPEW